MEMDWEEKGQGIVYPAGSYKVCLSSWERGESGQKKTPYIMFKSKILMPEEHRDRTVSTFLYLVPSCGWRLGKFVSCAGVDAKPLKKTNTDSPQFEKIMNLCNGRKMYWTLAEVLDDKGQPKNDVDFAVDTDQEVVSVQAGENVPDNIKWDE